MALGLLKPILTPILRLVTPPAAPAAAAQATAVPAATIQAASVSQKPMQNTPPPEAEGVKFDLSDKALQLVEGAAAAQAFAPPPQAAAAVQTSTALPAAAAASGAGASPAATASAEPKATVTAADPAKTLDPTEEGRARAWAIRGMEREKLLNLVETLKITPQADPAQKEVAEHTAAQAYVQAAPASERKTAA